MFFFLCQIFQDNAVGNLMFRFIRMIGDTAVEVHEGAVTAVKVVGSFAAKISKQLRHFRQVHAAGRFLTAVHQQQAVMARLIIADGCTGMRFFQITRVRKENLAEPSSLRRLGPKTQL